MAPFAEQLKKSAFTVEILRHAARVGHSLRTKVHVAWLGNTLRLEARDRRLELRPTANGIVAAQLRTYTRVCITFSSRSRTILACFSQGLFREFFETPQDRVVDPAAEARRPFIADAERHQSRAERNVPLPSSAFRLS